jgi:Tfp pilus assembly protein FimT
MLLGWLMPNCVFFRRDPPQGKRGLSAGRGFTVIELIVVVAAVVTVTSLALPIYRATVEKRQVTSGAEQIKSFLSMAQLLAVKRNKFVNVSYRVNPRYDASDPEDYKWCLGMVEHDTADGALNNGSCDCNRGSESECRVGAAQHVYLSSSLPYQDLLLQDSMDDGVSLVYEPIRGGMAGFSGAANIQLLSDHGSYALNVDIAPTGRITVCSDTSRAELKVPGVEGC